VPKAMPVKRFEQLDVRKGAKLGVWMVAKASPGKHSQNVAFCLYLAIFDSATSVAIAKLDLDLWVVHFG